MEIALTFAEALEISERAYHGSSDVLTTTRQSGEDVASLEWWKTDPRRRLDRGWRGRRDWAALVTYLELSGHAVEIIPENEFPTEFHLSDEAWCRPDKDIIKQGLRRGYLVPADDERLARFRITEDGLVLLRQIFPYIGVNRRQTA